MVNHPQDVLGDSRGNIGSLLGLVVRFEESFFGANDATGSHG